MKKRILAGITLLSVSIASSVFAADVSGVTSTDTAASMMAAPSSDATTTAVATTTTATIDTNSYAAIAQTLIQDWFAAMKSGDSKLAGSFLAPQFLSIHTDGVTRNRDSEIALINNLHMADYSLSDFNFSESGNDIVVTFKDRGNEKIDKAAIGSKAAARMAVLQKQDNKWLILAYANLDIIK